jgi:SAM-dependent methyltransferase
MSSAAVFDLYAAYYDLLYRDKDYAAETDYVAGLVRGLVPAATSVLELGCGTGGHALQLARLGFDVHGIDLSDTMVAQALARRNAAPELASRLHFARGDVRSHRSGRTFDAVLSLFHVISYQTTHDDLVDAFTTARVHLAPGGAFVFDVWYGPAVLSDRPRQVVKEVADERIEVRRETRPVMRFDDNVVDVHFDVQIRARQDGRTQTVSEVHAMRYLFLPELRALLAATGFALQRAERWMTGTALDDRSWYACLVARAV